MWVDLGMVWLLLDPAGVAARGRGRAEGPSHHTWEWGCAGTGELRSPAKGGIRALEAAGTVCPSQPAASCSSCVVGRTSLHKTFLSK